MATTPNILPTTATVKEDASFRVASVADAAAALLVAVAVWEFDMGRSMEVDDVLAAVG